MCKEEAMCQEKLNALRENGIAIPNYLPLVYAATILGVPKKDVLSTCKEQGIRTVREQGDVASRDYVLTIDLMKRPTFDLYVEERIQLQKQTDVLQAFFAAIAKIKEEEE